MKISLNWLKEYVEIPASVDAEELARKLTFAGFEVEAIKRQAKGLERIFVGELLEVKQHPNADRLSITRVDIGNALGNKAEILQIVCGARNIAVGQKVPVATLGAVIPNGLEIKASKIRGESSFGMLCSADELLLPPLAEGEKGIFLLDPKAEVGMPFAQYLGLDDVIFEINVTPNRGDALSHVGIAREVAALLETQWKIPRADFEEFDAPVPVHLKTADPTACGRYFARYIEGVRVQESPPWLKRRVESLGLRSINAIVDITSFVMFEIGQPLHAFDANLLEENGTIAITVRGANPEEKFSTISHKELTLNAQDIVVGMGKDGHRAAALAGVMGSDATEVSLATRNILLESADFASVRVRKANRGHAMMTDAAYRFERGVDPEKIEWALDRAASLVREVAGGRISKLFALENTSAVKRAEPAPVLVSQAQILRVLGVSPGIAKAKQILSILGFTVSETSEGLSCQAPSWRRDIFRAEDLIEEVGRIWGYENLNSEVPEGRIPFAGAIDEWNAQGNRLRRFLNAHGFFEALNYAFSSVEAESKVLGSGIPYVEMQGIQGREFNIMKTSLVPGLLRNLAHNLAHGRRSTRLFELRPCFAKSQGSKKNADLRLETAVVETEKLAILLSGSDLLEDWQGKSAAADFYALKGIVEALLEYFGRKGMQFSTDEIPAYLHPGQASSLRLGNRAFGVLGRVHPRVEKNLGLKEPAFVAEIDLSRVLSNSAGTARYKPFGKFPLVERDFSATVPASVDSQTIRTVVAKAAKSLVRSLRFFDLYRGERIPPGHISYAFRVELGSDDHTLTEVEISGAQAAIMQAMEKELAAKFAGL